MNNLIEFNDYINKYLNLSSNEWITIYENLKNEVNNIENDLYTFSVLSKNRISNKKEILKKDTWGFSINLFGKSYFQKIYKNDTYNIEFTSGEYNGIYEYLIAVRDFNNKYNSSIEINPKLIWYKNLVKVEEYYLEPETDEKIIRVTNNKIEVKKNYLKDFLSAYGYICVVCFDHRRFFESESDLKYNQKEIKRDNLIISYVKNTYTFSKKNAMASILGKVIVEPYDKPLHNDYIELTEQKQYENFIIGQDEKSGRVIEFTCDENKLANYFEANPEAPHFLTPVYFNKKVLNNYTTDTKNYTVMDSLIVYLDKWSLPYTVNNDGKVIVWLGDLGRIPYQEQKLWKVFNELPTGDIEELFYKRQIGCEWTDSSIKEKGIFNKIEELNRIFKQKYDDVLFNELSKTDKEIESAILIPATNSIPVYQNFLMQLSKITVERINKKFIKSKLDSDLIFDENNKEYGSRILLFNYLSSLNIECKDNLDKILKIIYNSRNKLSGHTGSEEQYNKVWGREKDYKVNYISDAKAIIISLYNVLNDFIEELDNE
ncbi:hypothetical protein HBF21_10475 [Clostridium perfringens]|uniref:hypothetical protein n=1 Tax=Clostridium perfringens TaxID=1502 RepID=UPI000D70E3A2|nr:hypothetical protein [Clostridium perfringens]MBI6023337.1 hypothetical protein [Clostridium perfringens]MBI6045365.1 hypothetical protein [Clostridium perfringens]MBI6046920.1 hypothetical protein [Clostridium perfringens]MDJ8925321.1 hypothetical protein [Clostridium perfringens]MDJ8929242.1 hypothetical protein [Clostridium perfringens]